MSNKVTGPPAIPGGDNFGSRVDRSASSPPIVQPSKVVRHKDVQAKMNKAHTVSASIFSRTKSAPLSPPPQLELDRTSEMLDEPIVPEAIDKVAGDIIKPQSSREKLSKIMSTKPGRKALKAVAQEEYSAENVKFIKEFNKFKSYQKKRLAFKFLSPSKKRELIDNFIRENTKFTLNIGGKLRKEILAMYDKNPDDPKLLEKLAEAESEVINLISGAGFLDRPSLEKYKK